MKEMLHCVYIVCSDFTIASSYIKYNNGDNDNDKAVRLNT